MTSLSVGARSLACIPVVVAVASIFIFGTYAWAVPVYFSGTPTYLFLVVGMILAAMGSVVCSYAILAEKPIKPGLGLLFVLLLSVGTALATELISIFLVVKILGA